MALGPLTMISVRLGSRSNSLIGLSSVGMSDGSAADGGEGARIMGQVLRKSQDSVSAEWTAKDGRSAAEFDPYPIGLARVTMNAGIPLYGDLGRRASMKRLFMIAAAIAALAFGSVAAYATSVTVSPWAYSCGHTTFGNPVTRADTPDTNDCPATDVAGDAAAAYAAGTLTLSKLCGEATAAKCTADDMASGATIGGLKTLTAASFDLAPASYCGAGAPRLNVVTSDGDTHFFGCAANKSGSHVSFNLTAAGDGNAKGGIVGKAVKSIDIVQDEAGTAILMNLSFTGEAIVTATPTPAATAPPQLATTGGGELPIGLLLGSILMVFGLAAIALRRRVA